MAKPGLSRWPNVCLLSSKRHLGGCAGFVPVSPSRVGQTPHRKRLPMNTSSKALIVGGGLAGLGAAYELRKRGVNHTVLEASPRTGAAS